jgi:hypothetical protein
MLAAVAPDRSAVEASTQTPIITTLYDLLAALSAASEPGEAALVSAAVMHLCHAGRLRFLAVPNAPVAVVDA